MTCVVHIPTLFLFYSSPTITRILAIPPLSYPLTPYPHPRPFPYVTLLATNTASPQRIDVWDWNAEDSRPVASFTMDAGFELLHFVRFNSVNPSDIISNGETQAVFWLWSETELTPSIPSNALGKLQKIGTMTQSQFIPYTSRVITATSSGEVILWDHESVDNENNGKRDAVKIIKYVLYLCV